MAFSARPHQRQPTPMREMMQRLGLDPGAGALPHWSLSYLTAQHRCEACVEKRACLAWLADAPPLAALPPHFCSNADIFFEMQMEEPGPHYGDRAARRLTRLGGI